MIGAILFFSMMDATVKALTPRVGIVPAIWARYSGQMLVVFLLVLPRLRSVVRTHHLTVQVLRSVSL
ncbi:MAG: EamA/RhaT family transporter, partial [Pseudomonadota bacterium]